MKFHDRSHVRDKMGDVTKRELRCLVPGSSLPTATSKVQNPTVDDVFSFL